MWTKRERAESGQLGTTVGAGPEQPMASLFAHDRGRRGQQGATCGGALVQPLAVQDVWSRCECVSASLSRQDSRVGGGQTESVCLAFLSAGLSTLGALDVQGVSLQTTRRH